MIRIFSYLAHPPSARHDQSYRSWLIMFSLKGYSFLYQNGAKIFIRYHFYLHLQIRLPLVVQFLTTGVWKVLYMGGIQNDQSCISWLIMFLLIELSPLPLMHFDHLNELFSSYRGFFSLWKAKISMQLQNFSLHHCDKAEVKG